MSSEIKMPSNSAEKASEKALEQIPELVTGETSIIENLANHTQEFDKILQEHINSMAIGVDKCTEHLATISNMLVAITKYLFGDASINANTQADSLSSKIQNKLPILGDTPLNLLNAGGQSSSSTGTIEVFIKGIAGKDLKTLIELVSKLSDNFTTNGAQSLQSIAITVGLVQKVVNKFSKIDFSAITDDTLNKIMILSDICEVISDSPGFNTPISTESFEELVNITPYINNIIAGLNTIDFTGIDTINPKISELDSVISSIANLQLSSFDSTYLDNILNFNNCLITLFNTALFDEDLDIGSLDVSDITDVLNDLSIVINTIANNLDFSKFDDAYYDSILTFGETADTLFVSCGNLIQLTTISNELSLIPEIVDTLKVNVIEPISNIDFTKFTTDRLSEIETFNDYILELQNSAKILSKTIVHMVLIDMFKTEMLSFNSTLAEFVSGKNGKGGLIMVMNHITKALNAGVDLSIIKGFFDNLAEITQAVYKIGLYSFLVNVFGKNILKSIDVLNNIIQTVGGIKVADITVNNDKLTEFATFMKNMQIVLVSCAICGLVAIPAIIGALALNLSAKLVFGAIEAVINGIKLITEDTSNMAAVKDIARILLVLGGILLLSALLGEFITNRAASIIGFGLVFGAFMFIVVGSLLLVSKIGGNTKILKSLHTLTNIIIVCSLILMLGAVFMLTGLGFKSLMFGPVLAVFIASVLFPFVIYGNMLKSVMKSAELIIDFIVICSILLVLGAVFMLTGLWTKSIGFALVLAGFVTLLLAPFAIFSKMLKNSLRAVEEIYKIIIVCSAILVIGALFMFIPGFAENALLFAALVSGFVFAIAGTFALLGKKLQNSLGAVYSLIALVFASTLALIIGTIFIKQYGGDNALIFAGILTLFVVLIGGVAFILGKFQSQLVKGLAAMAIIAGIAILFGVVIMQMAVVSRENIGKLFGVFGLMAALMIAIAGLSIALGALSTIPPVSAFFWAGIGAMAAIAGIAVLFSLAILNISIAAKMLSEASKDGIDITGALSIVAGMITIGAAMLAAGFALPMPLVMSASISMLFIAKAISTLGNAIADVANLKVATAWDKNGNATAWRQLSDNDFRLAAEGTEKIITTVGGAIIDVYKKNPIMFLPFGFKGNICNIVTDSVTRMGKMISTIGRSVAYISNLKVATAWDKEGNPTQFEQLNDTHFKNAGDNIQTIISTVGKALAEEYTAHPHLYIKFGFGGESPIERVITSATNMGKMMTSLALGVQRMANLKFADEWDKEGNPTHYVVLTNQDIENAATTAGKIVKTLGEALAEEYTAHPYLYAKFGFGGESPIERVITTASDLGKMMSDLARGIKSMANLSYADKWDKDGNPTHYVNLTEQDIENVAGVTSRVVSILATSINKTYDANPGLFDNFWGNPEKSKIAKVIQSTKGIGALMSEIATGIKDMANLEYKDASGKVVKIWQKDLLPNGRVSANIQMTMRCVGKALEDAYNTANYKDTIFNPEWEVYQTLPEAVKSAKDIVTDSLDIIKQVQESLKSVNVNNLGKQWNNALLNIFEPFTNTSKINETSIKNIKEVGAGNYSGLKQIITTINTIDIKKTDKFIQLANELSQLSINLGNMQGVVDALNGRINETLNNLSQKLEYAANMIKQSDDAQDKRQKLIERNTAKISEVMKLPMTVNVKTGDEQQLNMPLLQNGNMQQNQNMNQNNNTNENNNTNSGIDNTTLVALLNSVNKIKNKVCGPNN